VYYADFEFGCFVYSAGFLPTMLPDVT